MRSGDFCLYLNRVFSNFVNMYKNEMEIDKTTYRILQKIINDNINEINDMLRPNISSIRVFSAMNNFIY